MSRSETTSGGLDRSIISVGVGIVVAGLVVVGGLALISAFAATTTAGEPDTVSTVRAAEPTATENVTEPAYDEPVPEPGDPFFEDADEDAGWVSYVNPRDEYREPYLGDGSGKICVSLVNEAGEPIVGESVSDTSVTIGTGETLNWHSGADPFVVDFPLTDHYVRPYDADQFGTDPEFTHGDGVLDSHCLEWHGLPENATVQYDEVELEGEHADEIEVLGYVQQTHDTWDSDVDPVADAESYESTGGGWTYETDASHGQVVVVLQVGDGNVQSDGVDTDEDGLLDELDGWIGFGVVAALLALSAVTFARYR